MREKKREVLFMDDNKRIPPLRFPGFEGEWEEKKLGEMCYIQGGYAFKSNMFLNEGHPIIRIGNIQNGIEIDDEKTVYTNGEEVNEKFIVQKGDLLVAMSGATTGKTGIYFKEDIAYLNQRVGLFKKVESGGLYYPFLYGIVDSNNYHNQLKQSLVAGAQPNISPSDIENINFNFPSLPEQQKIADCLLTLDEVIELETQKLEQLQLYKKGLLQQLFV